jgi:hypothetical protein
MSKDNQSYFRQRAAEHQALAQRAGCPAAARAHNELFLRYSLKLTLPGAQHAPPDNGTVALPRISSEQRTAARSHDRKAIR